jgi:hypothetical protein
VEHAHTFCAMIHVRALFEKKLFCEQNAQKANLVKNVSRHARVKLLEHRHARLQTAHVFVNLVTKVQNVNLVSICLYWLHVSNND